MRPGPARESDGARQPCESPRQVQFHLGVVPIEVDGPHHGHGGRSALHAPGHLAVADRTHQHLLGPQEHPHPLPIRAGRAVDRLDLPQRAPDAAAHAAPPEQHGVAHEGGHRRADRAPVQVLRVPRLLDATGGHHGHLVGHGEGLGLVVRHEQRRGAGGAQHVAHLGAQFPAQARVEGGEGLVQEEHGGPRGQRPREGHAVPLSAGQLEGHAALEPGQAHHRDQLGHALAPLGVPPQAEGHVRGHVTVGKQRRLLRDQADAAPLGSHVQSRSCDAPAADFDGPRPDGQEPGDRPQDGRLPAAARPEHRGERARFQRQVDAVENPGPVVARDHLPQPHGAHGPSPPARCAVVPLPVRIAPERRKAGTAATSTSATA